MRFPEALRRAFFKPQAPKVGKGEAVEGTIRRLPDGRLFWVEPNMEPEAVFTAEETAMHWANGAILSEPKTKDVVWLMLGIVIGALIAGLSFFAGGR